MTARIAGFYLQDSGVTSPIFVQGTLVMYDIPPSEKNIAVSVTAFSSLATVYLATRIVADDPEEM